MNNATAVMEIVFPQGTVSYTWNCGSDGVVSFDFGTLGLPTSGFTSDITITSSSGALLPPPAQLAPGASWNNTFTEEVHTGAAGVDFNMTLVANETYTATGFETITTGAGTFNALRIDGSGTFATSSDIAGSFTIDVQSTYWVVEGVGFVRFETSAEGVSSVSDLSAYSIP
jgi:DUF3108-like